MNSDSNIFIFIGLQGGATLYINGNVNWKIEEGLTKINF
jgi:hypothetical protein